MDLHEACENGNEERVLELLGSSACSSPVSQLRARGLAGRTALVTACMGGQANVVRLLLGKRCVVYFTSRSSETEVRELLEPLVHRFSQLSPLDELFNVSMVTKDGFVVPRAEVQLPLQWTIPPQDLLNGTLHMDDFGNTPLQCVSCFGCGSNVTHLDKDLDITKQLLLHGDLPNLPKTSNKWTPLHWGAYHGNHEQIAMLLDPVLHAGGGIPCFAKIQFAIPVVVDSDNLFPVDIAGRRGLALREDRATLLQALNAQERQQEYRRWRLRLDHVQVVRFFIREFLANSVQLTRYVAEMNGRNPQSIKKKNKVQLVNTQDVIRYGQHLLYWAGCFGLVEEVQSLLQLEFQTSIICHSANERAVDSMATIDNKTATSSLKLLYSCSCEFDKKQSVLHAVAALGQIDVFKLLLEKLLCEQRNLCNAIEVQRWRVEKDLIKAKQNVVIPATLNTETFEGAKENNGQECTERLNVLKLVDAGWLNSRNETPLFQAALYRQDHVVHCFTSILSLKSIAWELENVNVEGSLLYHIVNKTGRQMLGIEHQAARPEYVMLFDQERRKQFKDSIIKTLQEESAFAPSLIVTRSGSSKTKSCKTVKSDYLFISVSDDVLIQQAQELQLKVKHRGSATRSIYKSHSSELFESFRSLQRQQVILSVIQRKIHLQKHIKNGNLKMMFPLHDTMGCRHIVRQWGYTDSNERIFQPFAGNSLEQFFLERKQHQYEMLWPLVTYFGEKHAFYYAFVMFYTVWLVPIAVIGVACQMLWLANNVKFVPPLFAIVVSIWATLLVERWKRKRSEIQQKFGHYRRNRSEEMPGFYGDFRVEPTTIRAKSAVTVSFPRAFQLVRIYTGLPVLLTMAVAAVVIFVVVKSNIASSTVVINVMPWFPRVLVPYVVPLLNAILMLVLDNWYTRLARSLTVWENHRTVWEFESMLATKLFSFKFLNAFLSLFWIAFMDQDAVALRKQLLIIMGVRQLWNSIKRDVVPMFHVRQRWKSAGVRFHSLSLVSRRPHSYFRFLSRHEWYNAELSHRNHSVREKSSISPSLNIVVQELMYPPDFLMEKQMEVVLQFGYVTMFVSVLPAAPLLALVSNVVAMRLDVLSCTQVKRRPLYESETEVSTFMSILEFMSFAAVAVNCAVLFFTTRSDFESLIEVVWPTWTKEEDSSTSLSGDVAEVWLLLLIEHIVLGTKALMSLVIEDSASWVRLDEDRVDEEEERMLEVEPLSHLDGASSHSEVQKTTIDRGKEDQSRLNQTLAKEYVAALLERDEALKREQQLRKLLAALIQPAEKKAANQSAIVSPSNNNSVSDLQSCEPDQNRLLNLMKDNHTEASNTPVSSTIQVTRRQCFVCFALRNLHTPTTKRCLSCHIALCFACDETVHLDDLGVKEPVHFRVTIPLITPQPSQVVRRKPDRSNNADECHVARGSKVEKKAWIELRRHIEAFISQSKTANIQYPLTSDEALKRCCGNISIALRYLRNHERQRIYFSINAGFNSLPPLGQ